MPVVGAANATAVAGGFEVLLGCDVVVASDRAVFGLPEVKRGLFAAGGGVFISTRIPLAIALELTLTGDPISAERALALGLVNVVVPPAEVMDAALRMAERIARNGPLALRATKELVRTASTDLAKAQEDCKAQAGSRGGVRPARTPARGRPPSSSAVTPCGPAAESLRIVRFLRSQRSVRKI